MSRKASAGRASQIFHEGWGSPSDVAFYNSEMQTDPGLLGLTVAWGSPVEKGDILNVDATFVSPVKELPDHARDGHVRLVFPSGGADRLIVLLGAWNDHGYGRRSRLARRLARYGVAALLLENPYFGARRPPHAGHPIATVVDFAVMGRAAVIEGRELMVSARGGSLARFGIGEDVLLSVGGFSMGGNLAAFASAVCPFPVATATVVAAHSPAPVFVDGVISRQVSWEALSNGQDPRPQLREFLGKMSVLDLPPPEHAAAAVLVGARGDGFVPPSAVAALHEHWPGSEMRWIDEGHASVMLLRLPTMVEAILDSFEKLEQANSQ